MQVVSITTTK